MNNLNISNNMVKTAYLAMEEKMAEDIRVINISDVSSIADYFVICNGSNAPQVQAIQDFVDTKMSEAGYEAIRVEGIRSANWILMDYGDVVIHIFSKEDRLFYDLERIWRDGKDLSKEDIDKL